MFGCEDGRLPELLLLLELLEPLEFPLAGFAASRLLMLNGDGAFVAVLSSGFGLVAVCCDSVAVTSAVALLLLFAFLALDFLAFCLDGDDSFVVNLRSCEDDDDDDGSKDGVCSFGLFFGSAAGGLLLLSVFDSLSSSLLSSCECWDFGLDDEDGDDNEKLLFVLVKLAMLYEAERSLN